MPPVTKPAIKKVAKPMNQFIARDDGSFLTPMFRVSFPFVFEPHPQSKKFCVSMLFPKDTTDMSVLQDAIDNMVAEKYPKGTPRGYFFPILDGDEKNQPRDEQLGNYVVNAKAGKYRPGLVDTQKQDIVDEAEFYAGCWARAVITIYTWENPKFGTKGISVGVRNIQKLKDDEPLVSRVNAADEFESVEDPVTSDL